MRFQVSAKSPGDNTTKNTSPDFVNKYRPLAFWVPDSTTPVKTIQIAMHIFMGPKSLTPDDTAWLQNVVNIINGDLANNCEPSDPLPGVNHVKDTKIRFELAGIYFYPDSKYYKSNMTAHMMKHIREVDSARLKYLSVLIPVAGSGTQNATPPYPSYVKSGSPVNSLDADLFAYVPADSTNPNWVFLSVLKHELGHCLDLLHIYNDGHGEECNTASSDYLWDVYGKESKKNCWLQGGWSCDPKSPDNTCTNNWMGGWSGACYLSPLQLGKIHRALSLKTLRRYVKNDFSKLPDYTISNSELWDFDVKWYGNIVVKKGVTWTVKGKISLPDGARITVQKGAKLIVDGGLITAAYNEWSGTRGKGKIEMKNGGVIKKRSKK
ncbi:MAG: M43 family zinc metalloprotease [Bacteroidota bacterium]